MPSMPYFPAAYCGARGLPRTTTVEPMLTIAPRPRLSMRSPFSCSISMVPLMSTASTRSITASSMSRQSIWSVASGGLVDVLLRGDQGHRMRHRGFSSFTAATSAASSAALALRTLIVRHAGISQPGRLSESAEHQRRIVAAVKERDAHLAALLLSRDGGVRGHRGERLARFLDPRPASDGVSRAGNAHRRSGNAHGGARGSRALGHPAAGACELAVSGTRS
jgi:hypothetical protein